MPAWPPARTGRRHAPDGPPVRAAAARDPARARRRGARGVLVHGRVRGRLRRARRGDPPAAATARPPPRPHAVGDRDAPPRRPGPGPPGAGPPGARTPGAGRPRRAASREAKAAALRRPAVRLVRMSVPSLPSLSAARPTGASLWLAVALLV